MTELPTSHHQRFEFDLSRAFPPEDPVGQFVIALAAAHNDAIDTATAMFPPGNPDDPSVTPAIRASLIRRALAQIWEVHRLVTKSVQNEEIDKFVDGLTDDYPGHLNGKELVAILRGDSGAASPKHRNVLRVARNVTNHYPEPGTPEFANALRQAIELGEPGVIVSEEALHTVRAEFADDVLLQLAIRDLNEDDLRDLLEAVGQTTVAIIHLGQTAMAAWLRSRGIDPPGPNH